MLGDLLSASDLLELFSAPDLEAFITTAFHLLRGIVRCDFVGVLYRGAGDRFVHERDSRGRLYDSEFMSRNTTLSPARQIALRQPGVAIIPTRTGLPLPDAELRQTPFYREVMQRQGWRHAIALCCWAEPPGTAPLMVLSVYRHEGRRDFSRAEIDTLTRVQPYFAAAVRQLSERETAHWLSRGITSGLVSARANTVLILDTHMRVLASNRRLTGGATPGHDLSAELVPHGAWKVCRRLLARWQKTIQSNQPPSGIVGRVEVKTDENKIVSVAMIAPTTTEIAEPMFVLETTDVPAASSRNTVRVALERLTSTERAVTEALLEGLSNKEIAERLGKTIHAVKFSLHRVYQRLGVPNRTALVAHFRS